MPSFDKIVPVSDFRKDAASILDGLRDSREPYVITRRGRPSAVLVRMDDYKALQRELEILRLLARGDAEISAGKGYPLDEVMATAAAIIDSKASSKKR